MVNTEIKSITFFVAEDGVRRWIQSPKTRPGADCSSDHQLLIEKFRLKLKKTRKNSRPVRYELIQTLYEITVEVMHRFKGQDLDNSVPEELWTDIHNTVQVVVNKTTPKKKKSKKAKWLFEEGLEIAKERREAKSKGVPEKHLFLLY